MSKSKLKDIASDALEGFDASIKNVKGNFEDARKAIEKLAEKGEINKFQAKATAAGGAANLQGSTVSKTLGEDVRKVVDKEVMNNIFNSGATMTDSSGTAHNIKDLASGVGITQDMKFADGFYGLPEAAATLTVVGLQIWKRNPLLSIIAGTIIYMVLKQQIF